MLDKNNNLGGIKYENNVKSMGTNFISFLHLALSNLESCPPMAILTLLKLNKLDPKLLIPFADAVVEALRGVLKPGVPRRIQTLLHDLWMKLNTMIPRRYVNASGS